MVKSYKPRPVPRAEKPAAAPKVKSGAGVKPRPAGRKASAKPRKGYV